MASKCDLTIRQGEKVWHYPVRSGLGFMAVCKKHETPLEFDCQKADCGICLMKVIRGAEHLTEPTHAEADFLKAMHADADERLACQCRIMGDVEVEVPLP